MSISRFPTALGLVLLAACGTKEAPPLAVYQALPVERATWISSQVPLRYDRA